MWGGDSRDKEGELRARCMEMYSYSHIFSSMGVRVAYLLIWNRVNSRKYRYTTSGPW